jgi:uncharacterized protein (TIGR03437 family)
LVTIFGENLALSSSAAGETPLPRTLGGTTVRVNGISAPLLYVSPTQINLQAPTGIADPTVSIVVVNDRGSSDAVTVTQAYDGAGIFTLNSTGCGPAAVHNINGDGSVTVNGPQESAAPGSFISIFATGLGPVHFPPADGVPSSAEPLSVARSRPSI